MKCHDGVQTRDGLSPAQVTNEEVIVVENGVAREEPKPFSWGLLAKLFAGIAAVGGLVLHMMGYVSHRNYLAAWGLDPGLFPKPADAIIIQGFYAVVDRTITMFSVVGERVEQLLIAAGIMTVVLFLAIVLSRLVEQQARTRVSRLSSRFPKWCSDFWVSLAVTYIVVGVVPFVLAFVVIVLAIPAFLGESYGHAAAERDRARYLTGCQQKAGTQGCIELNKDGKIAVRGFLIESSESHIAIFDVSEKRARALERSGTELFADQVQ